jgi:hypothetical protein
MRYLVDSDSCLCSVDELDYYIDWVTMESHFINWGDKSIFNITYS